MKKIGEPTLRPPRPKFPRDAASSAGFQPVDARVSSLVVTAHFPAAKGAEEVQVELLDANLVDPEALLVFRSRPIPPDVDRRVWIPLSADARAKLDITQQLQGPGMNEDEITVRDDWIAAARELVANIREPELVRRAELLLRLTPLK